MRIGLACTRLQALHIHMFRACLILLPLVVLLTLPPARAAGSMPDAGWSGERAMHDIATQLSFGARALGTPGHEQTIGFIKQELAKTAARVETQQWIMQGGSGPVTLTNIIARFNPENPKRIIVGTHYDSIVRAYRDRQHPEAPMPGANNSASGVAVLLETARAISAEAAPVGADLVFFDGEEGPQSLGEGDPAWHPLGSPYFAAHLGGFYPRQKPQKGVVLDMVCYKNLVLQPEAYSYALARKETDAFWRIGAEVAPGVFNPQPTLSVSDDQNALIGAGIPSILVIDFKYDPWFNTTEDTLDKCSAASLEAVGRTLVRFLHES